MPKNIFIVSGEASGDMHGAGLMAALKRLSPGLGFHGMGGERMRAEGLVGPDSKEVSVVGLTEVVGKMPKLLAVYGELKRLLKGGRFDALVLIDFPDFNLRLAKAVKGLGIPVIYYISPQVWAWRKGRVKTIAGLVRKMLVIFPFEAGIYRDAGVDVEYVGHPLASTAICGLSREEARERLGVPMENHVVSLLPGSRKAEVGRLLPSMLAGAAIIQKGGGRACSFLLPAANTIDDGLLDKHLNAVPGLVKTVRSDMYAALRASDAAIAASGTATLEAALIGTPMVIVYKLSALTYIAGRALVKVKNIGLPNIVAGRDVVRELIQDEATPENMAAEILNILKDSAKRNAIIQGLADVKRLLAQNNEGAHDRAAKAILKITG